LQFARYVHQPVEAAGAIEQRILRVQMQMDKIRVRHGVNLTPAGNDAQAKRRGELRFTGCLGKDLQTLENLNGGDGRNTMAGALTRVRAAVARTPCPDENLVMRTNRRPLNRRRGPEQREGRHAQTGGEMQRAGVAGNEDLRAL